MTFLRSHSRSPWKLTPRPAPQCAARGASRFVAGDASFATGDSGAAYAEIAAQLAE
jgi:pentose-5-phosphate-3-epimerase